MLENDTIRLRKICTDDSEVVRGWRFANSSYEHFYEFTPVTREQNAAWIQAASQRAGELNFLIEDKVSLEPIGMISLVDIDARNQKCEMGRVFVEPEKFRGRGYGYQAIVLLLEYAFLHLNMRKVYCEAFADNQAAIHCYKKAQFRQDGLFTQHIYKNGVFRDVAHFSCFKQDFVGVQTH